MILLIIVDIDDAAQLIACGDVCAFHEALQRTNGKLGGAHKHDFQILFLHHACKDTT